MFVVSVLFCLHVEPLVINDCVVSSSYEMMSTTVVCVYAAFHIVVCGLDSILARRWINGMLV